MEFGREVAGIVAALLLAASIPTYVVSILRGHTKPARMTYCIKSAVAIIMFASYVRTNGTGGAWTLFVLALSAVVAFGLAFRYGIGGLTSLDAASGALASLALAGWLITNRPEVALALTMLTKWAATIPTLAKVKHLPGTESHLSWQLALAGETCNLVACPRRQALGSPQSTKSRCRPRCC